MTLRVGGFVPFSSVDWPGKFAAVVFVQGCPWRCGYCHNPHLQRRDARAAGAPDWPALRAWLHGRVGLLDGVVFSGGEPTVDAALAEALREVRALGLGTGLHTAGMYPERLQALLPLVDWVGLDVKAPLADEAAHRRVTGVPDSAAPVRRSLALLAASGVDFECRTTAHPSLLDDAALRALAEELAAAGVCSWAVQLCRSTGCRDPLPPVAAGYPSAETLQGLRVRVPRFVLRAA